MNFLRAIRDAIRWHLQGRHAAAGVSWFVAWTLLTRWRYPTTAEYKKRSIKESMPKGEELRKEWAKLRESIPPIGLLPSPPGYRAEIFEQEGQLCLAWQRDGAEAISMCLYGVPSQLLGTMAQRDGYRELLEKSNSATVERQTLDALFRERGAIVSSADCSEMEIAFARTEGRFFIDVNGMGFVVRPRQWRENAERVVNGR